MTEKGRAYTMEKLQEKKVKLERRLKLKEASINDLLYSEENHAAVREQLQQYDDIIRLLESVHKEMSECKEDYCYDEARDDLDEMTFNFKHQIHNWLREVTSKQKDLERNSRRSKTATSNGCKSNRSSRSGNSSKSNRSSRTYRSHKERIQEEKNRLVEMQTSAAFMRKRTEATFQAEWLKVEEELAKARARVSILEEDPFKDEYDASNEWKQSWENDINKFRDAPATAKIDQIIQQQQSQPKEQNNIQHQSLDKQKNILQQSKSHAEKESQNEQKSHRQHSQHYEDEHNQHYEDEHSQHIQQHQSPSSPSYQLQRDQQCPRMPRIEYNESQKQSPNQQPEACNDNKQAGNIQEEANQRQLTAQLASIMTQQSAPSVDLEVFNGDPIEYSYFMCIFSEVVEKKVPDQVGRLMRLLKFTEGEPKDLIKHCVNLPKQSCYDQAKSLLERQYGNPHRLLAACRTEIQRFPMVKANDSATFRKLYNFLLKCEGLSFGSTRNPIDTHNTICSILTKLPFYLQDRWSRNVLSMRKKNNREPSLKDLISCIEEEIVMMSDPLFSREALSNQQTGKRDRDNKKKTHNTMKLFATNTTEKHYRPCPVCGREHKIEQCNKYLSLDIQTRSKEIFKKKLCYSCLKPVTTNHYASNCKNKLICMVCRKEHPTTLHGIARQSKDKKQPDEPRERDFSKQYK